MDFLDTGAALSEGLKDFNAVFGNMNFGGSGGESGGSSTRLLLKAEHREALAFSERARAFVAARVGAALLLVRESQALADRRRKLRNWTE